MPENSSVHGNLDGIDQAIVAALVANGRISFQELGRLVHLSHGRSTSTDMSLLCAEHGPLC